MTLRNSWNFGACFLAFLPTGQAFAEVIHVTGTATYLEQVGMPDNAFFDAVVQDISLADAPAVEIGRVHVESPGNPPYLFSIPLDSNEIDPNHTYAVRAMVGVENGLSFISDTMHMVLTRGASDHVEITMKAIDGETGAINGTSADTGVILAQSEATAVDDTPKIEMVNSENTGEDVDPQLKGMVTFEGDEAVFQQCGFGTVRPILPDGDYPALEHAFLAAGNEPGVPYLASFEGRIETLDGAADDQEAEVVLIDRFIGVWPDRTCEQETTELSLTNTFWKIERLGHTLIEPAPEDQIQPHLVMRSDESRFSATVGCNQMMGSFKLEGKSLDFGAGAASTLIACPEQLGEWERLLSAVLSETEGWSIEDKVLELFDADAGSIARFQAVPIN